MNRRELFQSAASVTAGAALFAADPDAVMGASRNARAVPERIFAAPFIETRDRAGLFYRDWGTGKAVVFVHSWAVHSDLW
jgi:hypothetical protein